MKLKSIFKQTTKQKLFLATTFLVSSTFLFACGSPFKLLPSTGTINIYSVEEKTTSIDIANEMIDSLKDDNAIRGNITEMYIYDRKDDYESKEISVISFEVHSETEGAEYVNYYVATCKYNEDRGWRVKEYVLDETKEMACTPKAGVDAARLESEIRDTIYATHLGTESTYINFKEDLDRITVEKEDMDTSGERPVYTGTARYLIDVGYCSYTGTIDLSFTYNDYDSSFDWTLTNYNVNNDFEVELSEDTLTTLSDESMLAALYEQEIELGSYTFQLSDEIVKSIELNDSNIDKSSCTRDAVILLDNDQMDITLNVAWDYEYKQSWELEDLTIETVVENYNFIGNYAAFVYFNLAEKESGEEADGSIYYSVLEQYEDGSFAGMAKYVSSDEDAPEVEAVSFVTTIDAETLQWEIEFDKELTSAYTFSNDILDYDPVMGIFTVDNWRHYYQIAEVE